MTILKVRYGQFGQESVNSNLSDLMPCLLRVLHTDRTSSNVDAREYEAVLHDGTVPPELLAQSFSTGLRSFGLVIPWFRREENLENEVRLQSDPTFRRPTLEVVRRALTLFLSHLGGGAFTNPRISRVNPHDPTAPAGEGTLVFDKDGERFALDQLSDGERFVLLLVIDLARRLAILARNGEPLDGLGVVVIDEIEQHLHPGWQGTLLPALHHTFPNLQFIATTHSPLVIASVPGNAVRLLHQFRVHDLPSTYGHDANSLLETIFGVPSRPAALVQQIREVESLRDAEDLGAARQRLESLTRTLTTDDPDVVRLRALLAFLAA